MSEAACKLLCKGQYLEDIYRNPAMGIEGDDKVILTSEDGELSFLSSRDELYHQ